jgi:2-keto-3-deoxy-L-rhamnonate aldolase RhmA
MAQKRVENGGKHVTVGQTTMQLEIIKRIKHNQPTFGAWIYLKDPAVTEMIAEAGCDWVIINMEHGNLNEDLAQSLIVPLKGTGCVPIVRVFGKDPDLIKKVLDTGAMGIMVPQIDTKQDAERVVKAVKYPPLGTRAMGYGRAERWGQAECYYRQANDFTLVILTIESKEGISNIQKIVNVPGVDVVSPGTYDLSGSLGVPGQFDHPRVERAKRTLMEACRKKNMNMGTDADTSQAIRAKLKEGWRFLAVTEDTRLIWQGAENILVEAKKSTASMES